MPQKLAVDSFKWRNYESNFNEKYIEDHNENIDKGLLKSILSILKIYISFTVIYHIYQKEWRSSSIINFYMKKVYFTHKNFEASIKSWISTEKSTQKIRI